jgi:hypothetical protein
MIRLASIWLCLASIALGAERPVPEIARAPWLLAQSPNFNVFSSVGAEQTRRLALGLEHFPPQNFTENFRRTQFAF